MIYLDIVFMLNFIVDLLLLLASNRIAGCGWGFWRCILGAAMGGFYGAACLLPGFAFLGGSFWRIVFLAIMAAAAYGINRSSLRRTGLYILLSMALGGAAVAIGRSDGFSVVLCAGVLGLICAIGFPKGKTRKEYARITLCHGGVKRQINALLDTGNELRDPISGRSVLVVGPAVAAELTGLTQQELSTPVETMAAGKVSGLRLIPYRAVGTSHAMLLAIRPDEVKFGKEKKDVMVAFAPNPIGTDAFEALAGGML